MIINWTSRYAVIVNWIVIMILLIAFILFNWQHYRSTPENSLGSRTFVIVNSMTITMSLKVHQSHARVRLQINQSPCDSTKYVYVHEIKGVWVHLFKHFITSNLASRILSIRYPSLYSLVMVSRFILRVRSRLPVLVSLNKARLQLSVDCLCSERTALAFLQQQTWQHQRDRRSCCTVVGCLC